MYAESEPKLLARTIGLTGFNLCRMLKEIFDEERCRSRRTCSMFSLLFVNIDRSVAYDDIYCHLAIHERCSARRLEGIRSAAAGHPSAGAVWITEQIRDDVGEMTVELAAGEYRRVTACMVLTNPALEREGDVSTVIGAAGEALCNATVTVRGRISPFSLFKRAPLDLLKQAAVAILMIGRSAHSNRREI